MVDLSKNGYLSPSKGSMTIGKIINDIKNFIDEDPKSTYTIVIGSDSQIKHNNGVKECNFVTAITVHRVGYGAKYFWKREKVMRAPVLHERIINETLRSLTIAQELSPILGEYIGESNYNLEIHLDVGRVGKTKEVISEVVGMITGSGFIAKTKPESWGASSVADKHT